MSGYIKLHRSIVDWSYWNDHNTTRILIYLLVSVNYEQKKWRGIDIKQGELVTSYEKLAIATGLTVSQVRRSLTCLENDKQITRKTTNKMQAITLVKWEELQLEPKKTTGKRQTNAQQKNSQTATTKESILFNNNILKKFDGQTHTLIEWIERNTPIVNKMNEPITYEQAERIQEEYNAKHTAEVFQSMHNYKKLLSDNQSAYLTFLNWMKRRQQNDATYGLKEDDSDKPKFKAAWQ